MSHPLSRLPSPPWSNSGSMLHGVCLVVAALLAAPSRAQAQAPAPPSPQAQPVVEPAEPVPAPEQATAPTPTATSLPTGEAPAVSEPQLQADGGVEGAADSVRRSRKKGEKDQSKIALSGYIQFYYKHRFDTNSDSASEPGQFRVARARLQLSGELRTWAGYVLEIDPRSPTLAGVMRDAYLELRVLPYHRILLGQQKTRFGYENTVSSAELYTITRSALSEGPARGVTLRDVGIGVVGRVPITERLRLDDAIAIVNGAGFGVQADDTRRKNLWGRVGLRYRDRARGLTVRAGVSLAIGDQLEPEDPGPPATPAFTFTFRRFGADLMVDSPWAMVAAEVATSTEESAAFAEPESSLAYYALLVGKTPWGAGPVLRYDSFDAEDFVGYSLGGYWGKPKKKLRAIAQYEIWEDSAGPHDHRLILMMQGAFR